jgi:hypothetical protein
MYFANIWPFVQSSSHVRPADAAIRIVLGALSLFPISSLMSVPRHAGWREKASVVSQPVYSQMCTHWFPIIMNSPK